MENKEEPYYQKSKKELADEFTVDLTEGLSSDEAEKRLKEDGLNKLEEKKTSKWKFY